jgi:hypothetical protein
MTTTFRLIAVGCILYILMTIGHDRTPVFRGSLAVECSKTP